MGARNYRTGHGAADPGAPEARVVEWRPGRRVTACLQVPTGECRVGILLAPGAGAGQAHHFLTGLRHRLAAAGHPTMTFDYPYVAEGRRAPDGLESLLACHRAAARALAGELGAVVLAGKSMGGRVATHLAAGGEPCAAVVCYGYPLLPPGRRVPRDTTHLEAITVPLLFLSGSRDRLAPLGLLRQVVERLPRAALRVLDGGDHSFGVKAMPDRDGGRALDALADWTVRWLAGEPWPPAGAQAEPGRVAGQGRLPAR